MQRFWSSFRPGRFSASRLVVAGALAAILLVSCAPSSEQEGNVGRGAAPDAATQIVMNDSSFDPDVLELPAGEEVTVQLTNEDGTVHDFEIEALGINTGTIEPGESAYATFVVPEQPVEFVCTLHPAMNGRIEPR